MKGNTLRMIIFFIIGLATIGLMSSLINNPGQLLVSLLIMAAVAFVIYMIFSFVMKKRYTPEVSQEMRKYKQAVKQSRLKYNQQQTTGHNRHATKQSSVKVARKRRRRAPHLTVIEGRKKES